MGGTFKYLIVLATLLSFSCGGDINVSYPDNFSNNHCLNGLGSIVNEMREVPDFQRIRSTIFADILLTQGPKEDLIIKAQPNILRELTTEVANGELTLRFNRCVNITQPVAVLITVPEIRFLTLTGVGDIIAQNNLDLNDLTLNLSGVGDINLGGSATNLDVLLSGVGAVRVFDLITEDCIIVISGSGDAEVTVNDNLDVTISGSGTVYYKGNPTIHSSITGVGKLVDSN